MNIKEKIFSHLLTTINDKILSLENILIELKESISNETKSTAGDKYETARAMLHLEQENIFKQLRNANDQRRKHGSPPPENARSEDVHKPSLPKSLHPDDPASARQSVYQRLTRYKSSQKDGASHDD